MAPVSFVESYSECCHFLLAANVPKSKLFSVRVRSTVSKASGINMLDATGTGNAKIWTHFQELKLFAARW